jgi:HAD superfamily hydrolase (TIGR01459 family)
MEKLSGQYRVWFCDIWGVVHNGVAPFAAAAHALALHRKGGGIVVLVTNAPRPAHDVTAQLTEIGVPGDAYDLVVTSGDVTRTLMTDHAGGSVFHIGTPRELTIFAGLDVKRVGMDEAHAVLCTGLVDDTVETPEDYMAVLTQLRNLKLPMICANPDKMVRKGDRLLYCAGALAERYSQLGGHVFMAGKPYAPIYELAMKQAGEMAGRTLQKKDVLAIGDGPETDIRGAADFGLDVVLIADGVTDASAGLEATQARIQVLVPSAHIIKTQKHLAWD